MSLICRLSLLLALTFMLGQVVDSHLNPNILEFEQRINDSPELKQYSQLYNNYRISAAFVASGGAIFAPTDRAFDKKPTRNKNNDIIIPAQLATKEIVDLRKAPKTLDTYGGLPLRLTKFFNPLGNTYEYYINNAKILGEPEVFKKGKIRYQLFTIDELIEPITYSESRILTAYELINEPSAFDQLRVDLHNVISFGTKINKTSEGHVFNDPHIQSTFFVPIESLDMYADSRIVNTHVIPNITLFSRTFSNETYRAAATDWNLCVNISFERERYLGTFDYNANDDWEGRKIYVKALVERHDYHQELLADGLIEGTTFSEIVLPNVPVKNGVVHFIKQALATPTTFLRDNLIELSKSQLARFYTFIRKYPTIFNMLHQPGEKTIFAFTNDAYDRVAFMLESFNSSYQEEILRLHISLQMNLNSRQMRMGEFRKLTSLNLSPDNVLHATNEDVFNRSVLYVDGQGVKARALESNILGVDGNIHIIDKVLGCPYQTVMEKLQSDPFLWRTYNVSTKQRNIWSENWALRLNNTHNNAKFTFFVPSENAWKNLDINYPSYYKQLNAGYYIRNALRILDRHLIINEAFTLDELAKKTEIQTLGGLIKIKTEGAKVFLEWEGIHAHIERPNINAINGVIHAIDRILFKEADMKVSEDEARLSSSTMPAISQLFVCLAIILSIMFNRLYAQLYNNYRISAAFVASGGAIFAPTDRAFDKKPTRNKNNDIIIPAQLATKEIVDLRKAPKTLDTYGGLPLRLTKFFNPLGNTYEYYINNAKILGEPEVFKKGKIRYQLFTIDELIEPITYSESRILTAYELINEPSAFDQLRVDLHNVISFGTKINKTSEGHVFNDPHIQSTFFVPIESLDMYADSRIVNTHVIPNITLFSRTFSNETYRAAATDWNLCVNISFERERYLGTFDYNANDDWEGRKIYVKALVERHDYHQELLADGLIEGTTFSEIVLPNVPVKNGVVHFIKQALATPTTFLRDNLIELSKSQLARFYTFIRKYPTIFNMLHQPGEKTIFAFTNDAYDRVAFMLESFNSSYQEEILRLHISLQMNLNSRQMRMGEFRKLTSLNLSPDNVLHATNEDVFNRSVLYVDGQGVKARALESNILGVDGNIHIIDKVLGCPYQTVMEKLQSDPFLWRTYNVSTKQRNIWSENWALRLNNTHNNAKFTFFVPSENAWKNLDINYPSYYKQLNAGYYIRNALRILDRHLIINEAFTLDELAKKTEIQTLGGLIKIKTEGAKVFLEWEGIHAHIERPNINAINGVIHAIDRILFKEADMKVSEDEARLSSSTMPAISQLFVCLAIILSIMFNRL